MTEQNTEWRCFHCDAVFTRRSEAQEHFGFAEDRTPACQVAAQDGGFLRAWREAESDLIRAQHAMQLENGEALKALRGLEGRLAKMTREAEELGYARGLADAQREYFNAGYSYGLEIDASPEEYDCAWICYQQSGRRRYEE